MYDTDKLLEEIENLRLQMSTIAMKQGITSLESIAMSQELDRLLNIYEISKQKDKTGIE